MELTWTTLDRARAMVRSKRDAGFTINAGFADEIAAAMDSEVEQRTKDLEVEKAKLLLQIRAFPDIIEALSMEAFLAARKIKLPGATDAFASDVRAAVLSKAAELIGNDLKRKCECIPGVHKNCPEHGYPAMRPVEGPGSVDE